METAGFTTIEFPVFPLDHTTEPPTHPVVFKVISSGSQTTVFEAVITKAGKLQTVPQSVVLISITTG